MTPNAERTGVVFGIEVDAPRGEANAARRREHEKRIGAGTMSRSGAQCPLCPAIMTMEDLRLDGRAGRLGEVMTAVVVDGPDGKEYRLPTERERQAAQVEPADLDRLYAEIPFGLPEEPTPSAARAPDVRGWTVVSRRSSELVPQFEGEGHGNQLSVAVPHQLCAGRVALASEPPAEAPDQTDSVAEARRRRQLA